MQSPSPNTAKVLVNDNLCANDTDPSMLGKTVAQVQGTADGSNLDGIANGIIEVATANGGTVAVTTATCEFNYKPPVDSVAVANGAATTSDSFTYMLTFGVGAATVSIGFVNQIWYVDNSHTRDAIAGNEGTSADPFTSIAGLVTAGAVVGASDTIFLHTGSTTSQNVTSIEGNSITLNPPTGTMTAETVGIGVDGDTTGVGTTVRIINNDPVIATGDPFNGASVGIQILPTEFGEPTGTAAKCVRG